MFRHRSAQGSSERGAVIVETAIVAPLLLLLTLGLAELGFVVRDSQTVVSASRAATRVISSSGETRLADYDGLATLAAALDDFDPADVEQIIVFKPEADGSMPPLCDTLPVAGKCNHYDGSDLSVTPAEFTGTTSCGAGSPDIEWCPLDRETSQVPGPDWIGVYIRVQHDTTAPFLPSRTISDTTVMRLEPRFEP